MSSMNSLPVEIIEKIFCFVDKRTLVNVALVCHKWKSVALRISRDICATLINPTVLNESNQIINLLTDLNPSYESNIVSDDNALKFIEDENRCLNILDIYSKSEIDYNDISELYFDEQEKISLVTSVLGLYFVVCVNKNTKTELRVLKPTSQDGSVSNTKFSNFTLLEVDGSVTQISRLSPAVIFVCLREKVLIIGLYKTNNEFPTPMSCNIHFEEVQNIKCDNEMIMVQSVKQWGVLHLYRVLNFSSTELELEYITKFDSNQSLYQWNLYSSFLTTIEASGHCKLYKIQVNKKMTENSSEIDSDIIPYSSTTVLKDLRYPNPAYLINNYIFVSTKTSARMLAYWHMDRGRGYWIVGTTAHNRISSNKDSDRDVLPEIEMYKVFIGKKTQTITSMYYSRRIILCGTSEGTVLLYHHHEQMQEDKFLDLSRKPDASFVAVKGAVREVEGIFSADGFYIAAKNLKMNLRMFKVNLKL